MAKLGKQDVIDRVSSSEELSKAAVQSIIDKTFDVITSSLQNGDTVTITGFGTFATSDRAARTGRNPQTGAEIQIAANTVPKFKAGKALKDAVSTR